jgi:hypothetical protein
MLARSFITIAATTAFLCTLFMRFLVRLAPMRATQLMTRFGSGALSGLCVFGLLLVRRLWGQQIRSRAWLMVARLSKWEFWPAWIFYPHVALYCVWQGIKHHSFSLPAIANLNQKNGGIVGESKIGILSKLLATSPKLTAEAFLVEGDSAAIRLARIIELCLEHEITMPFVLKPDIAQRGAGFKKIQSIEGMREYLSRVSAPLILQRYVAAPYEAGIFYYRYPGEPKGHILGITRKVFPCVTGDGIRTIRELIDADSRAQLIAHTYLKRFGAEAERVIARGEPFRLVEAGNHCQGCEFRDGSELFTRELLDTFDSISQNLRGFFVGRFDVRYSSDDEFCRFD